jgi:hypothetical protein
MFVMAYNVFKTIRMPSEETTEDSAVAAPQAA